MKQLFNRYSRYLKNRYGEAAYRVGVDAGFSCPNRREDGGGGCFYCDAAGSRAPYQVLMEERFVLGPAVDSPVWRDWMKKQIEGGMNFLAHRYGAALFILYIQAFSGTYAPVELLRRVYSYLLAFAPFKELVVGTRPDCFDPPRADLLAEFHSPERDVWLELGLQSFHDPTLRRIGRGHDSAAFRRAFILAKERGLKVAVHMIFGLPGEDDREIQESIRLLSEMEPDGIKIHNLHIAEGTRFAQMWRDGKLEVPDTETHLRRVVDALEILPFSTVIQRLTCDTPPERLLAPENFSGKQHFYQLTEAELERRGSWQGSKRNR